MVIQDLQAFLESPNLEGGAVSVDLLKIARNVTQRQQPQYPTRKIRPIGNKLKLIMDAECCLDRLYGGFFSDWACGGQWNRMVQFLSLLMQAIERGNIELAIVFNGTSEPQRFSEWTAEQANIRQKVGLVLKHVNMKGTPPPKIWWTPPTCLRTSLRMALRHLNAAVMCTMDDHHQEVIAYCREYGFHGLLADNAEYAAFDPPRYFSSEHLKLTYKGSLETKEYMIGELTKALELTTEQVCVLAAILGNFLLPEVQMQDIYRKILEATGSKEAKLSGETGLKSIAEFVRTLSPPSNMDSLVVQLFGSADDKRVPAFRQSVQYYLNGTANGFLKYCSASANGRKDNLKGNKKGNQNNNNNINNVSNSISKGDEPEFDTSGFASETTEQEIESLQNYKLATANAVMSSDIMVGLQEMDLNSIKGGESSPLSSDNSRLNGHSEVSFNSAGSAATSNNLTSASSVTTRINLLVSSTSSNTSSVPTSPKHGEQKQQQSVNPNPVKPTVSLDVLRTASLRHQKGLMAPLILHVLSTQEVRLPCLMEDENYREFPPIHEIYRPLRQRVYAVLFNLHHLRYVHSKKKEAGEVADNSPQPDIIVKEWVYSRANPYQHAEQVKADPLPWAVPTLNRLWFGPSLDDKRRRMRALLSCLNSDTPLILNTSYVPQHMLVMACVLRYIMSQGWAILRRQELDAFIAAAFSPDLMNAQYLQDLTLTMVTSRGVQLAAIFMEGVEMALLANDACGAPLPWLMCCPWLYFDGKLFHHTLARTMHSKNLLELCENHIEWVVKVERMRKAVLEGLDVQFAKLPLPPFTGLLRQGMPPPCNLPTVPLPSTRGAAGLRQRPIPSRGGQLQVAGVVVGSWGANYGYMRQQPQVTGGRGRGFSPHYNQGQNRKPGPPTYNVNKKNNANRKKAKSNQQRQQATAPKGRGMTVKTNKGDVLATDLLKNETIFSPEEVAFEDCKSATASREHHGQGDAPTATHVDVIAPSL
ncbi:constitutive coactivator of PPAR-gamma-like protein 1 isoform X2 [Agrilus planipennis]|uniref:Constitutive coactivator of PPAR-gamma-like protein 1 isoform X2 n=1 Tax=Agrilus planipennis TaxID=224129 RepID=A0A7F5RJB8_AGRPL|nr:constitutive coactivator of PPAR-gamma-like protein 1 isoform X2 [Agrilus planipennis]XP_025835955.1 constitutive coactivator of PPAR-gamma-like protein 1 isoform X2 [Agrilus planipennis]